MQSLFSINQISISKQSKLVLVFFSLSILLLAIIDNVHSEEEVAGTLPIKLRYIGSIDGRASGLAFAGISSIYVDSKNNELFVTDAINKRIVITDLDGVFLFQFSYTMAGLKQPSSIVVAKDGRIFFADGKKVVVVDYNGNHIKNLDVSLVPKEQAFSFQSVDVSDNYLFVGEIAESRILVFDIKTLEYISEYKDGLGSNVKLSVSSDSIYALDPSTFSVYILDLQGNPKGKFGKISGLTGGFSMPVRVYAQKEGDRVAVVDLNRAAVIFFDSEGNFLYEFGGSETLQWPREVALDSRGRVYVSDKHHKVRIFSIIEETLD